MMGHLSMGEAQVAGNHSLVKNYSAFSSLRWEIEFHTGMSFLMEKMAASSLLSGN